jgi:LysR family transcriptional regulator, hydrogen peroxide-inducible genes activator
MLFAMPSLRQLQYLVLLRRTGHFRLAAEKAGVSQPTLSAQLQALEQKLGVQLAERGRSPVIFTQAGEQIVRIAERIVASVKEIEDTAKSQRGGVEGVIKLGLPTSIGPYLLPYLLPQLRSEYPALRFHIRENLPAALPDQLANGTHDLIMLPLPVRADDFEVVRLFREPIHLAVPADHPLASLDSIDASELQGQDILALERGHALHDQVQMICDDFGARVSHDYEGTSLNTLHQMVASGLGFTFLPGLYTQTGGLPGIKLLSIKSKPVQRSIGLIWRKSSPLEKTYRSIAVRLKDCVKQRYTDFMIFES